LLEGLGYVAPGHALVQWARASQVTELDAELQRLTMGTNRLKAVIPVATFEVTAGKRSTLELALAHLLDHAPVLRRHDAPS